MKVILVVIFAVGLAFLPVSLLADHMHKMVNGEKVIMSHTESDLIEAEWAVNAENEIARQVKIVKEAQDKANAIARLIDLGFTDDEIKALFKK